MSQTINEFVTLNAVRCANCDIVFALCQCGLCGFSPGDTYRRLRSNCDPAKLAEFERGKACNCEHSKGTKIAHDISCPQFGLRPHEGGDPECLTKQKSHSNAAGMTNAATSDENAAFDSWWQQVVQNFKEQGSLEFLPSNARTFASASHRAAWKFCNARILALETELADAKLPDVEKVHLAYQIETLETALAEKDTLSKLNLGEIAMRIIDREKVVHSLESKNRELEAACAGMRRALEHINTCGRSFCETICAPYRPYNRHSPNECPLEYYQTASDALAITDCGSETLKRMERMEKALNDARVTLRSTHADGHYPNPNIPHAIKQLEAALTPHDEAGEGKD